MPPSYLLADTRRASVADVLPVPHVRPLPEERLLPRAHLLRAPRRVQVRVDMNHKSQISQQHIP